MDTNAILSQVPSNKTKRVILKFSLFMAPLPPNSVSSTELLERDIFLQEQRRYLSLIPLALFSQCGRGAGGEGYRTQVEQGL